MSYRLISANTRVTKPIRPESVADRLADFRRGLRLVSTQATNARLKRLLESAEQEFENLTYYLLGQRRVEVIVESTETEIPMLGPVRPLTASPQVSVTRWVDGAWRDFETMPFPGNKLHVQSGEIYRLIAVAGATEVPHDVTEGLTRLVAWRYDRRHRQGNSVLQSGAQEMWQPYFNRVGVIID